jgi:hypothetical protein
MVRALNCRFQTSAHCSHCIFSIEYAVTWDPRLFLRDWNACTCRADGTFKSRQGVELTLRHIGQDAKVLGEANRAPLDYHKIDKSQQKPVQVPANGGDDLNDAMVNHFIDYAKYDYLGVIGMLWQDHAGKHGAGNWRCVELAKLHSIAVDFAKSGIAAEIPPELHIPRDTARAHWRQKMDSPFFHCTGILGRLFDEVESIEKKLATVSHQAVVGRIQGQYGLLLDTVADENWATTYLAPVFNQSLAERCGLSISKIEKDRALQDMLAFALAQRRFYEDRVIVLMNKYKLRCEGELVTGRIRQFHPLHKAKQNEYTEQIRQDYSGTFHVFSGARLGCRFPAHRYSSLCSHKG